MNLALTSTPSPGNPIENDLEFPIRWTKGSESKAQEIRTTLRVFLGEWFLDLTIGIPYFREVFVKAPDLTVIRGIFRAKILEKGVRRVKKLDLSLDKATRTLSGEGIVIMDDGSELTLSLGQVI